MFDDGRHGGIYEFEPPIGRADLHVIVDQIVSSGVDTLLYSAGLEGGVVQFDSHVAQKWGDNVTKWTHPVFYRAARVISEVIAAGHDPMHVVCERCHEKGLWFIPGTWVCILGGSRAIDAGWGRKSDFALDHPEFQVGIDDDPRAKDIPKNRLSFLHQEVRAERLALFEELLIRYESDGIELNLSEYLPFCKFGEVDRLAPLITQWLRGLRVIANRARQTQGRWKRVLVRIPAHPVCWKEVGFEVAIWISENLVDGLILVTGDVAAQIDQDLPLECAVDLTRGTKCRVYAGCSSKLGGEHEYYATQPMMWAAAANAYSQGSDGFAVLHPANWAPHLWPWADDEYETLRLLGHPDLLETADKLFRTRSPMAGDLNKFAPLTGSVRPLPRTLVEGELVEIALRIADRTSHWHALGRIDAVRLRIRLTNLEPALCKIRVDFNGRSLPDSLLQPWDLTYRMIYKSLTSRRPHGYVFEYRLTPEYYPNPGLNTVALTLLKRDAMLEVPCEVSDLECSIEYRAHRNFERNPVHY